MTDKAFEEWKENLHLEMYFQGHTFYQAIERVFKEAHTLGEKKGVAQGIEEKWIAVEDRLPPQGEPIILMSETGVVQHNTFCLDSNDNSDYVTGYFWDNDLMDEGVDLHDKQMWQPLPSPPKANEEKSDD